MFYKYENDELEYSPTVLFPDGVLLHTDHLTDVSLPHEGWHYFESMQLAKDYFGIKE